MPKTPEPEWIEAPPLDGPIVEIKLDDVVAPEPTPVVDPEPEPSADAAPSPEPDVFGRIRVCDLDTLTERSIHAAELPHGNYLPLSEPASDIAGAALPPKYPAPESPVEPTTSGQSADTSKENNDG